MDIPPGTNRKRKQKTLTLVEKVKIIDDFERGGGSHESLARKYGVGSSSVTRFLKHRKELRQKLYQKNNAETLFCICTPLVSYGMVKVFDV